MKMKKYLFVSKTIHNEDSNKIKMFPTDDETIDYTKIDFESRRMKSRRAHEEVISGRYRHPNLLPSKLLNQYYSFTHKQFFDVSILRVQTEEP